MSLSTASAALFLPTQAAAGPNDPLVPKIAACKPTPDRGLFNKSTDPGWLNKPEHRKTTIRFGLHVKDKGDSIPNAMANTQRIEICEVLESGDYSCPGTEEWLVYQVGDAKKGSLDFSHVGTAPPSTIGVEPVVGVEPYYVLGDVPIDWGTTTGGDRVFTIRVTPGADSGAGQALLNGFCLNWHKLAAGC